LTGFLCPVSAVKADFSCRFLHPRTTPHSLSPKHMSPLCKMLVTTRCGTDERIPPTHIGRPYQPLPGHGLDQPLLEATPQLLSNSTVHLVLPPFCITRILIFLPVFASGELMFLAVPSAKRTFFISSILSFCHWCGTPQTNNQKPISNVLRLLILFFSFRPVCWTCSTPFPQTEFHPFFFNSSPSLPFI